MRRKAAQTRHEPPHMMRTFRYPLRPTVAQAATLESWRVACQQLYNGALQERKDAWRRAKVSISRYDQHKSLTILRQEPEWAAIPALVARSSLDRIDKSFNAFFRRVKAGDKPGFPRFKSRDRYGSIGLGRVTVRDGHVHVQSLGPVPFFEYRPLRGSVRNVVLSKDRESKWFVCIQVDLGPAPAKIEAQTEVGMDLGLTTLLTLSTGEGVENPRWMRDAESRVAKLQRELARKQRRSARRHKARLKLARAYAHVRNQRMDHARKLAVTLFNRFDLIAYEDLNVRSLAAGMLSKSVNDAAWTLITNCLTCKAEEAGKHAVAVDPRGTTIDCSSCGHPVPKLLSERMHRCDACGLVLGRDHNAAIGVLNKVPAGLRVHARRGRLASCEASASALC